MKNEMTPGDLVHQEVDWHIDANGRHSLPYSHPTQQYDCRMGCGRLRSWVLQLFPWLISLCLVFSLTVGVYAQEKPRLTAKDVETALRQHIVQQGPWQPTQIDVVIRSFSPREIPLRQGTLRILKPRKGVTPGLRSFLLAGEGDNAQVKKVWVRAEVRIFDNVVVTSRPLAHFEMIAQEAVRLDRRDISALSTRAFTRIADIADQQAVRAIQVNEILTPAMVQLPQVVRRGSPVTLVYESTSLRVVTPGLAMEGGKVGDVIRVKNSSSGQILEGNLIDDHTVKVSR